MHKIRGTHVTLLLLLVCGSTAATAQSISAELKGNSEVPANGSTASGIASISVAADKSVTGNIITTGIAGTMAHIHTGMAGANGPVMVALSKNDAGAWNVPVGTKLSDEQYAAYMAGGLYVNVHSAAHPGGEIRAQLLPK
jgi:hypothetical protein